MQKIKKSARLLKLPSIILAVSIFFLILPRVFFTPEQGKDNIFVAFAIVLSFFSLFITIFALIFFIIRLVIAIIELFSKENESMNQDCLAKNQNTLENSASEIPAELHRWNWGAAGVPILWGIFNRVWLVILTLIPILNIFIFFVLGFKGNEYAWKKNKTKNLEAFKQTQEKWAIAGLIIFILNCMIYGFWIYSVLYESETVDFIETSNSLNQTE